MLVLSRKKDEKIIIGDAISIMVIDIRGDKVRLGIDAPRDVTIHREEVYEAIQREGEPTSTSVEVTSTANGGMRIEFDVPKVASSEDEAAKRLASELENEGT
ncbi:carbon storage regulator CsrA [Candidatus Peribacteria bacterium]|jgi:carbon storage regulator|nr:carbon storage regulator CsrA [Candidatus Peribacteria bacterium]